MLDVEKPALPSGSRVANFNPNNMAFSPNGTELATTHNKSASTELGIYNGGGAFMSTMVIPQCSSGSSPYTQAIQWTPDGKRLLLDFRFFVDRELGRLIWNLDYFNKAAPGW